MVSFFAVCATAAGTVVGFAGPDALAIIKRAIATDTKTTFTCIREWTDWEKPSPVRVRVDQSCTGASKVFVLAPITRQGYAIIDDGKQRTTYNPDKRELAIQDSPLRRLQKGDTDRRIRLLKANYSVAWEASEKVAGRPAHRVRVLPRSNQLFSRRYWIDESKGVMLRVEWTAPDGKRQVMSNTISIDFPESLPPDTFARRFVGELREVHIQAPKRQRELTGLGKAVGFSPINPVELPFGMVFIGADAILGGNRTMAALRYTDGAANVTIYQTLAKNGSAPWSGRSNLQNVEVDDVWMTVDGDLPTGAKTKFAANLKESGRERSQALAARAAKQFSVSKELVVKLRAMGLDFGGVVISLAATKGREPDAFRAGEMLLQGRSIDELADSWRVKEWAIKSELKRFLDMRDKESAEVTNRK
jgi:hypothetical protein